MGSWTESSSIWSVDKTYRLSDLNDRFYLLTVRVERCEISVNFNQIFSAEPSEPCKCKDCLIDLLLNKTSSFLNILWGERRYKDILLKKQASVPVFFFLITTDMFRWASKQLSFSFHYLPDQSYCRETPRLTTAAISLSALSVSLSLSLQSVLLITDVHFDQIDVYPTLIYNLSFYCSL